MKSRVLKSGYSLVTFFCIYVLSFFVVNSLMSSSALTSRISRQKKEKVVEKGASPPNQPIIIFEPKAAGKSIKFKEGFEAGDDWLKEAGLKLKNVSNREVVFVQVDINFPETKSGGPEMSFPISFGHHPNRNNSSVAPLSLPPGSEMDVVLDGKTYENLRRFIEYRQSIKSINKAVVRVGFVIFADGLGYSGSYYRRRDPNNPTRWVPLSDAQGNPIIP